MSDRCLLRRQPNCQQARAAARPQQPGRAGLVRINCDRRHDLVRARDSRTWCCAQVVLPATTASSARLRSTASVLALAAAVDARCCSPISPCRSVAVAGNGPPTQRVWQRRRATRAARSAGRAQPAKNDVRRCEQPIVLCLRS